MADQIHMTLLVSWGVDFRYGFDKVTHKLQPNLLTCCLYIL